MQKLGSGQAQLVSLRCRERVTALRVADQGVLAQQEGGACTVGDGAQARLEATPGRLLVGQGLLPPC